MERFRTDGAVLKTSPTGEADLVVFILTRERGLIRAFARGARSPRSRLHAGAVPFGYSDMDLTEKNGVYYLNAAGLKETFYDLRLSLPRLTLAQYFCEVLLKTATEGSSDPDVLRLFLNALFLLSADKKPMQLIKSVFELRYAALSGFMPALVGCDVCGAFETPRMHFDAAGGRLLCERCAGESNAQTVPLAVISAMRHIVFSEFEGVFSFSLEPSLLPVLGRLTSGYLSVCSGMQFRLLRLFYESLE